MIRQSLSVVELPALFGPMMPTALPGRTSNDTSRERPEP